MYDYTYTSGTSYECYPIKPILSMATVKQEKQERNKSLPKRKNKGKGFKELFDKIMEGF